MDEVSLKWKGMVFRFCDDDVVRIESDGGGLIGVVRREDIISGAIYPVYAVHNENVRRGMRIASNINGE